MPQIDEKNKAPDRRNSRGRMAVAKLLVEHSVHEFEDEILKPAHKC